MRLLSITVIALVLAAEFFAAESFAACAWKRYDCAHPTQETRKF
jgi:hypothetical protein